jgi:hypothetical protein
MFCGAGLGRGLPLQKHILEVVVFSYIGAGTHRSVGSGARRGPFRAFTAEQ